VYVPQVIFAIWDYDLVDMLQVIFAIWEKLCSVCALGNFAVSPELKGMVTPSFPVFPELNFVEEIGELRVGCVSCTCRVPGNRLTVLPSSLSFLN
jgi:hypothetical protein